VASRLREGLPGGSSRASGSAGTASLQPRACRTHVARVGLCGHLDEALEWGGRGLRSGAWLHAEAEAGRAPWPRFPPRLLIPSRIHQSSVGLCVQHRVCMPGYGGLILRTCLPAAPHRIRLDLRRQPRLRMPTPRRCQTGCSRGAWQNRGSTNCADWLMRHRPQ
jgi:hypothetical protein